MKRTIGIIGLGLIGGSLALDLKASGFAHLVYGCDTSIKHQGDAFSLGLVDKMMTIDDLMKNSDIIIIATPVNLVVEYLEFILDNATDKQLIIDVGSTKNFICQEVKSHKRRRQYVACHPMAGTEFSGPEAAIKGLFDGKINVICNKEASAEDSIIEIVDLFNAIGMHSIFQDAKAHDVHAAYVSHISHISSFALALTVLEKEQNEDQIFDLASGGFASTVRLAKSAPNTWRPIFEQNRDNVLDVLDEHINVLSTFRSLLIKKDFNQFHKLMEEANDIKRILEAKK